MTPGCCLGISTASFFPRNNGEGCFQMSERTCLQEAWIDVISLTWGSLGASILGKDHVGGGGRLVSRRLDRGLSDTAWRLAFPEATVEHLVKRCSDHNPLLLRCCTPEEARKDRPFRFLAAWCGHADYTPLVRNAWNKDSGDVTLALHNVR